ncbi:MAG: SprT family protein [Halobacillus sp.]|uniref:SprT family protein n=1 Tax=Halobacillus sp. TaxID=56800 RepID=UPI003BB07DEC
MKLTNEELQQWTEEISLANFQKPYVDNVEFNPRLRTTGGRYIPSKRVIELNPKYLEELGEEEFKGIIKHELCHYHLHIEGKGYKHGDRDFKELLKTTNSPRFCEALPSQKQKQAELHYYMCTSCGREYTRKRRVNTKRYGCGKCRGKLKKK